MRFLAIAPDYDGTLAGNDGVDPRAVAALQLARASGRKLILITGRELDSLFQAFPQAHLFDLIVAENGALLYRPSTREERPLAGPPPKQFVQRLRQLGVEPLSLGRSIVATLRTQEGPVWQAIREMGLELQVIFNREALMVLPAGVDKSTGLSAALGELGLPGHQVVGIGDAENDHAFLRLCGCSVAVANALDTVKQHADLVTLGEHSIGVAEVIHKVVATDLLELEGPPKPPKP